MDLVLQGSGYLLLDLELPSLFLSGKMTKKHVQEGFQRMTELLGGRGGRNGSLYVFNCTLPEALSHLLPAISATYLPLL